MKKFFTTCMLLCLFCSLHATKFPTFRRQASPAKSLHASTSSLFHGSGPKAKPLASWFLASFNRIKQSHLVQHVTKPESLAAIGKIARAGIFATVGYAAYKLFNYIRYTSNKSVQHLIARNQETYTQALTYQPLIDILLRAYEQQLASAPCLEDTGTILNELLRTKNQPYATLMQNLNRILQKITLDKARTELTLKKVASGPHITSEQKTLYRNLEHSLQQLSAIEVHLKVVKDYIARHQRYIELSENAQTLNETLTQIAPYAPMIQDLETRYGHIPDINIRTVEIDESLLNQFAATNPDIGATIQTLELIIRSLESKKNLINAELQHVQNPSGNVHESLAQAEYQIPYLQALKNYLAQHKDYFAFYTQEIRLITRYGNGLEPIALPAGALYPHIDIVSRVEQDLAAFNPIKQKIAALYPSRREELGTIEYRLRQQIAGIIESQIYQEELRRRKDDEHKQAMLLEQRRIADAEEHQAAELRKTRVLQQATLQAQNLHTQELVTFNGHIRTLIDRLNESRWSWKKLSGTTDPIIVANSLEDLARTVRNTHSAHMH